MNTFLELRAAMLTFRRIYREVLIPCVLVSFCVAGNAAPAPTLRFEQLGQAQGLISDSVLAIAQDDEGFMWFGGQGGLSRYDGYRVTTYKNNPSDPYSLANDWILDLHIDERGRLWIGTQDGLHLYDKTLDRFIRYEPKKETARDTSFSKFWIQKIVADGRGGLWLSTPEGLQHFDPASGQFSTKRFDQKDPDRHARDFIYGMARDARGNLWIGTGRGLDCLAPDATTFSHFRIDSEANPDRDRNQITSLLIDDHQTLWIGTLNGVEAWSLDSDEPQRRRFGLAEGAKATLINNLYQDKQGNVWVATTSEGLLRWDKERNRFVGYRHQRGDPHSLAENNVVPIYQDQSGTLWLGTWGSGVSRVDLASGGFTRLSQDSEGGKNLAGNQITGLLIVPVSKDRLWVTSDGGLNLIDTATQQVLAVPRDPTSKPNAVYNTLRSVAVDGKGQMWVASEIRLYRFDRATGRPVASIPFAGDTSPSFRNIVTDRSGMLWALTNTGLYRFDPGRNEWRNFAHKKNDPTSLVNDYVTAWLEDSHGTVWVGTLLGLERLDPETGGFTHFHNDPKDASSLGRGTITTVFEDSKGVLWVGSETGLSKMEAVVNGVPRFHFYPMPEVDAILEDRNGRLWISTDNGISRLDPATMEFKNYTARDGMIDGPYWVGSVVQGRDGKFYFGGANGLTIFRPEDIHDNPTPPQVRITDFQIFNKSVGVGNGPEGFELKQQIQDTKALTLSYLHSVFSIEFAALHFADPQRNKFAYQLQGFDKNWIYTDATRHFATYTNLDPGNYVFRIKAANKDGVWNDTGAALGITITPPFWKTWWFRTVLAALLFSGAWAGYLSRIKNLVNKKAKLEQQVVLRTSEVVQQKILVEQKNQELEKFNRALQIANRIQEEQQSELTRFLAVASHDLRQPMHALNLYLGVLQNVDLPKTIQPIIGNISRCTSIMDDMFLALLDLSRLDSHLVQPQISKFPIARVLEHLEVEFAPQASSKGLQLTIQPCSAWIESDPGLVQQILGNLIANAVRYTEKGWISVSCHIRNGNMRVAVHDTGIGISPDKQMTIFEEFCQLGNSGRDRTKGLGLGLAIVKRLSKLLGAPVTLVSSVGRGSTFSIENLQLATKCADEMGVPSKIDTSIGDELLRGRTILVIDDDASILDAMRVLLEQWGCEVLTASSGKEAIATLVASGRIPDALICDRQLKLNESAQYVINDLRKKFDCDIPALLITGDTAMEFIQEISESGLPVLYKPVQAGVLRDVLIRLFRVASI